MSIKLLDLYSKPIGFLFHKQFNFRTSIGGILTLFIVGLLALLFFNFINNMIDRSLPTIFTDIDDNFKREINLLMKKPSPSENSTNQDYNLAEDKKYNSASAYFSLLIRNTSSNKVIPIDQSYFTIDGYFIVNEKNKLSNVTKLDSLFCSGYGPVSSSEFEYMMLNNSYCFYGNDLKLSNFKLVNEKKGFLQMTIRKCGTGTSQLSNNTIKCKSDTEINNILRSLSFEFIYLSTSINSTNYENPISFQIETRFYNPIVDYYKEMYLNIEVNKLESYNLFLPSYLQKPTVEYVFSEIVESSSSVKNSTLRQVNNGKILDVIISSSTLKRTYRRYYLNIIDIIASIGGSFYVIYALFYIILISYVDLRYIEKLVNSFYKVINPKYDNILSLSFEKFLHFHYNRLMNLFITKNKQRIISFLKTKNMFHQSADTNNKPLTDNLTNKIKEESKKSLPVQVGNPNVEIQSNDLGNTENLMDVSDYNHLEMYFTLNRIENIFGFNFENRLNEIYSIAKNTDRVEYYSNPLEPQKKMSYMKKTYENNGNNINPLDDYINKRNEKEERKKNQNGFILDTKTRISHLKNLSIMSKEGKDEKDGKDVKDEKDGKEGNEISNDNNNYFEDKDIVNNENHILIDENNIESVYKKLQYIDYYNKFFSDKPSNIIYHKTKMIYNLLKYECFNGLYFSTIEIVTLIFCGCFFKKRKNKNDFSEKEQTKSKPSQKQVEMENKQETNRDSREGNKDKESELKNNQNKSYLLKKLKLKENIKKGKFDDDTILNGSSVSYIEGLNKKITLIDKTSNDLKINFDISNILSSVSDFENFKKCYFNKNQVFLFNSISSPLITYDSEVKDHEIDANDYEKIEDLNKILEEIIIRGEILPIEYSLIMVMGGSKEQVNEFMNEVVNHSINLNEELKKNEYLNSQSIDDQESKKNKDNDYEVYDSDQSYVMSNSNKDENKKSQVKSKKKLKSKKTKKENEKIIDEEDFINQMERFNQASNQKKMETNKNLYENKENVKDYEKGNQKSENNIPKYVDEIEAQSEREEKKEIENSNSNSNNKSNSLFKLHHSFDDEDEYKDKDEDEDENEEVLDEKEESQIKEGKKENEFNSKLKLKVNKNELFKNNYNSDDSNDRGYAL